MNPKLLIYKPRFTTRLRALTILLPVLFFSLVCLAPFSLINLPVGIWALALLLSVPTSLLPFFIIREIRFLDDMIVRRHFLPDLVFSLKEIEHIGQGQIHAAGRIVRLGHLANQRDLEECFRQWKAAKLLKESRTPAKTKPIYYPQRGYGTYASFWGLVIGVILIMMTPSWLAIDTRWVLAVGFLAVYMLFLQVVPRIL